jgi:ABC-type nitrate/sulfonate/bicarbonate transport system ATPase subunit
VAIIQQVISCGHLLLMDEPFSGLDPLRKEDVQNLILNISMAHELNTIILTTHDIHAAIQVCDTITLLGRERNGDGHIIQGAKVAATYNLVERGLAWRPKITEMIQFRDLEREIVAKFHEL